MMNIPAIIGASGVLNKDYDGKEAIVDGFKGILYIDPDEATTARMKARAEEAERQKELLLKLRGVKSVTKDGQKIELCANIGNVLDIGSVLSNDAEGIGLFRSEFLYLEAKNYPTRIHSLAHTKKSFQKWSIKELLYEPWI